MNCVWFLWEDFDPINRFNFVTFLCLSQARTWISNVICLCFFFVVVCVFNELNERCLFRGCVCIQWVKWEAFVSWLCVAQKTEDWAARTPLKTNNDRQNTTQKTKDWAARTPLKTNKDRQNTTQKTKDWAARIPLKQTTTDKTLNRKLRIEQHEPL
jgi:hypothetical protein